MSAKATEATDTTDTTDATDREIVDLLIGFMESFKGPFVVALEKLDLPISQGHVLMRLDEPTAMSAIARRMGFDASHVTALIDGLEGRGLIERRPDPHDRRIKRITLTPEGTAIQDEIRNCVYEGLPPLARLTPDERIQLRNLLATAIDRPVGSGHGGSGHGGSGHGGSGRGGSGRGGSGRGAGTGGGGTGAFACQESGSATGGPSDRTLSRAIP
jgi:DNA-binding MarR family transcriptional regulator